MIGLDRVVAARSRSVPVGSLWLHVTADKPTALQREFSLQPQPDGSVDADVWIAPSEVVEVLDLTPVQGVAVTVFADDRGDGLRVMDRALEFGPRSVSMLCPTALVRSDREGLREWDL